MNTPVRTQITQSAPHTSGISEIMPAERSVAGGIASQPALYAPMHDAGAHAIAHSAPFSKEPSYPTGSRSSPPLTSLAAPAGGGSRFAVQTPALSSSMQLPLGDYTSPVFSHQLAAGSGAAQHNAGGRSPADSSAAGPPPAGSTSAKDEGPGGHWSQRATDGSAPTSSAAANANCQWLGRTVRITRGKREGQQGIVTKSGHGFYCVRVSDDETLMKRGHEIELVGGGSLRPKAPRSPAQNPHAKLAARSFSPGASHALAASAKDGSRLAACSTSRMVMRSPSPTGALLPEPMLPVHAQGAGSARCEECAKPHAGGFGSGRFCSKSCGARFAVRSRALSVPTPMSSLSAARDGAGAPAFHAPIALKAGDGVTASSSAAFLSVAVSPTDEHRSGFAVPHAHADVEVDSEAALAARALLRIISASSSVDRAEQTQPSAAEADWTSHDDALAASQRKRLRVC